MVEANEPIKKGFNIERDSIPIDEQKKIKWTRWTKIFWIYRFRKKINPDNLIYKYKNERISPKGFRNCQYLIELFKDLR